MIAAMTPEQVAQMTLTNSDASVTFSGAYIQAIMSEYDERMTVEHDLLSAWNKYNFYSSDNFWLAYNAMYSAYNPLNNYDMTETETAEQHDGNITNTRSTDNTHNKVTTAAGFDTTVTVTADGTNKPTTKHYTTTYEDDSQGRLASYDENTGKTTTQTTGTAAGNTSTVTDDLTVTNAETHTPTTATVNGLTISADKINGRTLVRSGNIGVMSSQQLITAEIALRAQSLLYDYIARFIDRYTYFAGGAIIEYDIDTV